MTAPAPAADRLCCCYLPPAGPGCGADGEIFEIQLSLEPTDRTNSCRTHLGDLIDSTASTAGADWRASTVRLAQSGVAP